MEDISANTSTTLDVGNMYSSVIDSFFETYHIDYTYGVPLLIIIIVGLSIIFALKVINDILIKPYSKHKNKEFVIQKIVACDPELNAQEFQNFIFETYAQICKLWTAIDYQGLSKYLSNDLYLSFCNELEVLKQKGERNVMDNVNLVYAGINNIRKENNLEIVEILLTVELNNYTIDSSDNIISGSKNNPMKETSLLTFQKILDLENQENNTWVMDKKKILKQEVI